MQGINVFVPQLFDQYLCTAEIIKEGKMQFFFNYKNVFRSKFM